MPKAAPYRLSWNPEQGSYSLHDHRSEQALSVAPDSHEWFDCLANIPSFTFRGQHGDLTIRQETLSGSTYWSSSSVWGAESPMARSQAWTSCSEPPIALPFWPLSRPFYGDNSQLAELPGIWRLFHLRK